ncbi:MAG TPA: hypothetical protein PKZ53_27740 [Acidobacteriota bacterium]|nr:hypothetical protein [Acidobacteriota bacterium]
MTFFKLADPGFWEQIRQAHGSAGGAYQLVALENEKPVVVQRFLGADLEGVLYIGKSDSYLDRVIQLKKSISPQYAGKSHTCGRRYKSNPAIALKYPYELLHLQFFPSGQPELLEKQMLGQYFQRFGEVPPLNAVH